jgi:hypothetical protein
MGAASSGISPTEHYIYDVSRLGDQATSIDDAAERFQPKQKQSELLARNKKAILRLRSKGATYAQIRELLRQNGTEVSEASIIRFCRRYVTELKREGVQPESTHPLRTPSEPQPLSPSQPPFRDLRGPV